MADKAHLKVLLEGVPAWNTWREEEPTIQPDLEGADLEDKHLSDVDLHAADLSEARLGWATLARANLRGAILVRANLRRSDLCGADLEGANLRWANLTGADLGRTNLRNADLQGVDLSEARLPEANLSGANLARTICVRTVFERADLSGCAIYGIAAWDLAIGGAVQADLRITPDGEQAITVDDLEVAQFLYLMLHNKKIRQAIGTVAKKLVLILGRFTPERKLVLDALRNCLRARGYLPVVFDFDRPEGRDLTETVSTLAHLARFVIADLTAAKSVPHELARIVPHLPSVAVQPLIHEGDDEYAMFEHFQRYPWVLSTYRYQSVQDLVATVQERIIEPAERYADAAWNRAQ
jgi:uncharacterized protein YjbI with pentapeptide repeats